MRRESQRISTVYILVLVNMKFIKLEISQNRSSYYLNFIFYT